MSLLNSQTAYIDNEPALTAIHESQHRVHAMSLIHQKLYNTDDVSSIDMSTYIRELVAYLSESFDTRQRIRFDLDIEPVSLDVGQAVPLGLILNEAITNSIKYAFPGNRDGRISIRLSHLGGHHYRLTIADDGIGVPEQIKEKKTASLGMSLMSGLSEDLDGSFSIENRNGTLVTITFIHDMELKRPNLLASALAPAIHAESE
jgi:two-component sensor histidine kinase